MQALNKDDLQKLASPKYPTKNTAVLANSDDFLTLSDFIQANGGSFHHSRYPPQKQKQEIRDWLSDDQDRILLYNPSLEDGVRISILLIRLFAEGKYAIKGTVGEITLPTHNENPSS